MPLGPFGGVVFDGVQFNTDPSVYEPLNWAKRFSVTQAIGGKVVIQDFGTFMKDNTLRLGSGSNNPLDDAVVQALHSRFRTRGVAFTLTDWLGNQFTVFMKVFVPIPLKKGIDRAGNASSLYTYTLELQVTQIVNLFGVAYTGS